jgi:hypothetical protein
MSHAIFVFGSNLAGRHGAGAALFAKLHRGAVYRQGEGRQGDSYAIPTKDENLHPLALSVIAEHVRWFIAYAQRHPELQFELTPVGCGLCGYTPQAIAPMFKTAPGNVVLPPEFRFILDELA